MVTSDDVLNPLKSKISDDQELRIRALFDRARSAYQRDRTQGIKSELESDWNRLKARFQEAVEKVKKETNISL